MNIAMFLSPKSDIEYLYNDMTLRQAMEKMEFHRYQCLAVLTRDGRYDSVVTEGDLLWGIKSNPSFTFQDTEHLMLSNIPRHFSYEPVRIDQDIESLITKAYQQSFIPVVDDQQVFIGIIKRSTIIRYMYEKIQA